MAKTAIAIAIAPARARHSDLLRFWALPLAGALLVVLTLLAG